MSDNQSTEYLSQYVRIMASISDTPLVVSKLTQIADRLDEQNERIKRLEEAGDVMANAYRQICYDAYDDRQVDNWFKAKEAKP